jgi:hypothetical protein
VNSFACATGVSMFNLPKNCNVFLNFTEMSMSLRTC